MVKIRIETKHTSSLLPIGSNLSVIMESIYQLYFPEYPDGMLRNVLSGHLAWHLHWYCYMSLCNKEKALLFEQTIHQKIIMHT